MSTFSFSHPRERFNALFAASSEPQAQLRAALLGLSLLGDRSGGTHPANVCLQDGPTKDDLPYFSDDFFEPMERQLAALFARCTGLDAAPEPFPASE